MEEFLSKKVSDFQRPPEHLSIPDPALLWFLVICCELGARLRETRAVSRRDEEATATSGKTAALTARHRREVEQREKSEKGMRGMAWGIWIQKRNQEEGKQEPQLEKEHLHLGQSNEAARQRQDLGRGSMLLCQVRPRQAAPPLMHVKAANTYYMQGELSREKSHVSPSQLSFCLEYGG